MYGNDNVIIDDKEVEEAIRRQEYDYSVSSAITCQFIIDRELTLFLVLHCDQRVTIHCQLSSVVTSSAITAAVKRLEEELNSSEEDFVSLVSKTVNLWPEIKTIKSSMLNYLIQSWL